MVFFKLLISTSTSIYSLRYRLYPKVTLLLISPRNILKNTKKFIKASKSRKNTGKCKVNI